MYDLVIIGAGPAGITASVYAARKKMNFLVITRDIGGQAAWSGDIENYTGYQFVTGPELAQKFEEHMRKYDILVKEGETVTGIKRENSVLTVTTDKVAYETRSVIIASGKRSRELGVPQEAKFKNRGLTYCATCDGPLFSDKAVAVVGGGNSALDAALQLINIARQVYVINIAPALVGDAVMRQKVEASPKAVILNNAKVTAISGENMVSGIRVKTDSGEKDLAVEGIFVEIGLTPNSEFATLTRKNAFNEIKVDSSNQTNLPGIFAAGDVTDVPEKQIIVAAGEGAKAALSAFRYLSQHKF